jgi:hypothetical protein
MEKVHTLKKERSLMEGQMVMMSPGSNDHSDFERTRLRERVQLLESKLEKKVLKIELLDRENDFYNQIITLFLTIKKVIEKEKMYCYVMA